MSIRGTTEKKKKKPDPWLTRKPVPYHTHSLVIHDTRHSHGSIRCLHHIAWKRGSGRTWPEPPLGSSNRAFPASSWRSIPLGVTSPQIELNAHNSISGFLASVILGKTTWTPYAYGFWNWVSQNNKNGKFSSVVGMPRTQVLNKKAMYEEESLGWDWWVWHPIGYRYVYVYLQKRFKIWMNLNEREHNWIWKRGCGEWKGKSEEG